VQPCAHTQGYVPGFEPIIGGLTDVPTEVSGGVIRCRAAVCSRIIRTLRLFLLGVLVLHANDGEAQTRDPTTSIGELKKLSVEQLTNVEVTSVSRAEERLGGAAAAVTVVTNEDIRRSGATTVTEALRMVPGIHVGRQTTNLWAVSSRGFSSVSSEKLLVLSDARSIYTPLFSGVFWDVQDYLLQDIERIEVIRGPGATLWGSNAVSGVINRASSHWIPARPGTIWLAASCRTS
jgi:iron complex outermembrane recepter protein